MEVHRVKAVRFSLPLGEDHEEDEEDERTEQNIEEGVMEHPDKPGVQGPSRSSSQQHLAGPARERGTPNNRKKRDFLCGLCCSKPPAVSVWNCDGELLPHTEISCRYGNEPSGGGYILHKHHISQV